MSDAMMTDLTTRAVVAALDGTAMQQRLAANNLANLETPGYRAHHADFQDRLRQALRAERRGDGAADLDELSPQVRATADPPRPDGNNVSIESEMTGLAEATTRYEILTRLLDRRFAMIGVAIGDGRAD